MDGQALPAVGEQDARARGYCQKLRRGIVGQMQAAYIPAGSTWLISNPETSVLIQKRHPYTGNLNPKTSRDRKNVFLHCGDVLFECQGLVFSIGAHKDANSIQNL